MLATRRMLATRVGSLVLHVPKFRDGTLGAELFTSYQRSEQALLLSLMEMVTHGGSTRKISEITETLCGTSFSKSTVSALCGQLDPVVDAFRNRPLSRHTPFLMVDAITMKAREQHRIVSKGFLIATSVNDEGFREVLGFTVADGESEAAWNEFFLSLKERGLRDVDLVTSDDHGGLTKAIRKHFCGASWQHCQTHFSKNILDRTPKRLQPELKVALTDLENAPDLNEATAWKNHLLEQYQAEAPKEMRLLDERFDEITAVYSLPEPYRKRLRTSNSIERLNEELRRRERVIRIFPNEASMIRLMGSILMEMHEKWMTGKNSFTMERTEADKEDTKNAMQLIREPLNQADEITA